MCETLDGNELGCELQDRWRMNKDDLGVERGVNSSLFQEHQAILQGMNSWIKKKKNGQEGSK